MRNSEASIKEVNVTANLDHDHLLAKTTLEGGDVLGDPTNRDRSLPDIRIREGEARKRRSSVGLGAIEPKDPLLENRLEDHRPGRTRSFGTLSLVHRRLIRSPTSPDPTPAPAPARARTLHDATPPPPPPPRQPAPATVSTDPFQFLGEKTSGRGDGTHLVGERDENEAIQQPSWAYSTNCGHPTVARGSIKTESSWGARDVDRCETVKRPKRPVKPPHVEFDLERAW
ncbi:hypothetical protein BHE74_00043002 [Ensete ventricosum]|nr:hypothetical protein BHE74_00043002 [Ensete ventricosum]